MGKLPRDFKKKKHAKLNMLIKNPIKQHFNIINITILSKNIKTLSKIK
jgi:hypothetical protein